MDKYLIIIVVVIILNVIPFFIAQARSKKYIEEYIRFLGNNGISVSTEDARLINVLVRDEYKNNLWLSLFSFSILLIFQNSLGVSIMTLLMGYNFYSSINKFKKTCPYCFNRVDLDAIFCSTCTKSIRNYWRATPKLEHFHTK